jgi:hypothetical protein
LGEDLEIQNKISRGKKKVFLSSTRKKNKLEIEKKLKHNSRELEKQREIMLPKEGIKRFVCSPCDYNNWAG